jgi:hypothetical protein
MQYVAGADIRHHANYLRRFGVAPKNYLFHDVTTYLGFRRFTRRY